MLEGLEKNNLYVYILCVFPTWAGGVLNKQLIRLHIMWFSHNYGQVVSYPMMAVHKMYWIIRTLRSHPYSACLVQ